MKGQRNHFELYKIDGVGVDLSRFRPHSTKEIADIRNELGYAPDEFIVSVVAELNANKNQIMLLKAVPALMQKIPKLKILLIGKETLPTARQFVERHSLGKAVNFLGYRKDVERLTAISDAAFSASFREGLPVNIIEAMACGLPVVCSDNRGHRSLVKDKETGFIFSLNNEKEMSDAIILLYKNPSLRAEMGMRNVTEAKKYSVDTALNKMSEIYDSCIRIENLDRGGYENLVESPASPVQVEAA